MKGQTGFNIAAHFIEVKAADQACRIASVEPGRTTTFGELQSLTACEAARLRNAGCTAGDRVLLAIPDGADFAAAFFGAAMIGVLPVPVSPFAQPADYAYYLADSCANAVIAHASVLPRLKAQVPVLIAGGNNCQCAKTSGSNIWPARRDDPAFLLYTSGSTGRQKGTIHSHGNMIAASERVGSGTFQLDSSDFVYSLSKLPFAFGLGFGLCFPLYAGASTLMNPPPTNLQDVARLIATHRPTVLAAVPSVLASLIHAAETWLTLDLSSLRFIVSAGEPLPPRVFEEYRGRYGIEVVDGIGSTEMLTHFISNRPGEAVPGCCGVEVNGYQARLLDDAGNAVPTGEIGTLEVEGPTSFLGYTNGEPRLAGGWVNTGDRLYRDPDGYYHYSGRSDDMIKVTGMWVSPREVESAILQHPSVHSATVTAREDKHGYRRVVAYLIPAHGCSVTAAQLVRHLAQLLPDYMIPAALVILSEFPLTATGKINRAALPAPTWR